MRPTIAKRARIVPDNATPDTPADAQALDCLLDDLDMSSSDSPFFQTTQPDATQPPSPSPVPAPAIYAAARPATRPMDRFSLYSEDARARLAQDAPLEGILRYSEMLERQYGTRVVSVQDELGWLLWHYGWTTPSDTVDGIVNSLTNKNTWCAELTQRFQKQQATLTYVQTLLVAKYNDDLPQMERDSISKHVNGLAICADRLYNGLLQIEACVKSRRIARGDNPSKSDGIHPERFLQYTRKEKKGTVAGSAKIYFAMLAYFNTNGFRKHCDKYYEEHVITNPVTGEFIHTHFWRVKGTIDQAINVACRTNADLETAVVSGGRDLAVKSLIAIDKIEFPALNFDTRAYAFKNGIFITCIPNDRDAEPQFLTWTEVKTRYPSSLVACKFFEIDFPEAEARDSETFFRTFKWCDVSGYANAVMRQVVDVERGLPQKDPDNVRQYFRGATPCSTYDPVTITRDDVYLSQEDFEDDVALEPTEQDVIQAPGNDDPLPTPHWDQILSHQEITHERLLWFYLMAGRCLFPARIYDKWSVMLYLWGRAGTGKTTILEKIKKMYAKGSTGTLCSNVEPNFALWALMDKQFVVLPEVTKRLRLPQSLFQQMLSGEVVSVTRKGLIAEELKWNKHMAGAGNVMPGYEDTAGAIARRMFVFMFSKIVKVENNALPDQMDTEVAYMLIKCAYIYRRLTKKWGSRGIWVLAPKHFLDKRKNVEKQTSSFERFVKSYLTPTKPGTPLDVRKISSVSDIREAYIQWCNKMHITDAPTLTSLIYSTPLQNAGIELLPMDSCPERKRYYTCTIARVV